MKTFKIVCYLSLIALFVLACKMDASEEQSESQMLPNEVSDDTKKPMRLSQDFKDYWYSGEAEITSYTLEQARYGEIRNGHAVLIYVTEDFLPEKQVKADRSNPDNISVLKLNATKKFNTGIYPYSVMQSIFYPVSNNQHAIKVSASMQEWCGHVYAQLNNREQFELSSHSYFETEADQNLKLDKSVLENELWTQLRLDPSSLPQGDLMIVPSFEFIRLKHVEAKAYLATATIAEGNYTLDYPDLNRSLSIDFNPDFPYEIHGWEETFKSGFGPNAKMLTTKATHLKSIKSAYWG
ncbi:MAG: septum formation inhibitor Maf, partial [Flavobacteriaceae bacterium]|nr:septum formation inhibitor Maf [Flavobacteriaceae bacterium]